MSQRVLESERKDDRSVSRARAKNPPRFLLTISTNDVDRESFVCRMLWGDFLVRGFVERCLFDNIGFRYLITRLVMQGGYGHHARTGDSDSTSDRPYVRA